MLTIRSTLESGIVNSRNWCSSSCSPVKVLHLETSLYHCSWVSVIIYVLAGGCWKRLTHGGLFLSFIDKGLQSGQVLHGSVKYTRKLTDKLQLMYNKSYFSCCWKSFQRNVPALFEIIALFITMLLWSYGRVKGAGNAMPQTTGMHL